MLLCAFVGSVASLEFLLLFSYFFKAIGVVICFLLQILEIKSLIGYFDLEPNKVAALFLGIWQDQWDNDAYLRLLPLFSTQAISASLAFIFITYQVRHCVAAGTACCTCSFFSPALTWHDQESAASGNLACLLSVMTLHGATGSGIACFRLHVCYTDHIHC